MSFRFPVEAGQIMLFARAIGDASPSYVDDGAGAVPAPPTFPIASAQYDSEYSLRPKPGQPWFGSGKGPCDDPEWLAQRTVGSGLHAEQHFEYHRPLSSGDVVAVESSVGRTWEKEGRSGTLVFTEWITRYLDADGEPVVTARSVGVQTQTPVEG